MWTPPQRIRFQSQPGRKAQSVASAVSAAAALSASMFAPFSVESRRLMTDAKPSSLIFGMASGPVAPAHANVASPRV